MSNIGVSILLFISIAATIGIEYVYAKKVCYTHEGLLAKVMEICCSGAVGKRLTLPKLEKEEASTFTSPLRKKRLWPPTGHPHLRSRCCKKGGCKFEKVRETSLQEECLDECCYNEEIEEVCN